jgi:hypothetical protein
MKSILDIIKPIKLIHGNHTDTAKTGSGCIMNIASYLAGDAQVTDNPDCVCPEIRDWAMPINDYSGAADRQELLPYVLRMIGTKTTDQAVTQARVARVMRFQGEMEKTIHDLRGRIGLYFATYEYKMYLDWKLGYNPESHQRERTPVQKTTHLLYYAVRYLHAAEIQYSNQERDFSRADRIATLRDKLLADARQTLIDMLPAESAEETDAMIVRAKTLVETKERQCTSVS